MVDAEATAKFGLLREIFELVQQQREAIAEDDLDRFGELLESRRILVERLQRLADGEELPANVIPFPSPAGQSAHEDALALDTLIRAILAEDREHEVLLRERLAELGSELPALESAQRSIRGYRLRDDAPRFIDRAS